MSQNYVSSGNFIPGAAGVGIVETTLTKAMQDEGMLGPAEVLPTSEIQYEENQRQIFSSEAGKRSDLKKRMNMLLKNTEENESSGNAVDFMSRNGDKYTKIGTANKPPKNP